jgi:hypothetical protein
MASPLRTYRTNRVLDITDDVVVLPTRTLEERIQAAFDPTTGDIAFGEKYLELVYANWCAIASSLRRTSVLIVTLMVAFLSLAHTRNTQFTLGPIRLTNVASVLVLVPAIVSLLTYEFFVLGTARIRYRDAVRALIRLLHPSVWEHGLGLLLEPPTTSLWSEEGVLTLRESDAGVASKLVRLSGIGLLSALIVAAVSFLVYAYVILYGDAQASTVAVSASLLFAIFNGTRGLLVLIDF